MVLSNRKGRLSWCQRGEVGVSAGPGRCPALLRAGLRGSGLVAGQRPGRAPRCASQARGSPWLPASAHFLSLVPPLAAGRSLGFQIPLLGATGLAVICAAVIAVVVLARKVTTPAAPLSHGPPTLAAPVLSGPLSVRRETWMCSPLFFAPCFVVFVLPFSEVLYALLSLPRLGAPGGLDLSPPRLAVTDNS